MCVFIFIAGMKFTPVNLKPSSVCVLSAVLSMDGAAGAYRVASRN